MSRETVARSTCQCCGGEVAVKTNVSGKAYYSCDHCGVKVQHTWQRSSDAFLAKVAPKKPEPAPAPAASSNPPAPAAPARRSAGTILG
jgi:hypothetical protein